LGILPLFLLVVLLNYVLAYDFSLVLLPLGCRVYAPVSPPTRILTQSGCKIWPTSCKQMCSIIHTSAGFISCSRSYHSKQLTELFLWWCSKNPWTQENSRYYSLACKAVILKHKKHVSKYQEYVHIYGIAEKSQQQKIEELQAGQDVIKHQEYIHSYKIAEKSLKQKSKICRLAKMLSRIKSTYIAIWDSRGIFTTGNRRVEG
jgi:hypothetical protein